MANVTPLQRCTVKLNASHIFPALCGERAVGERDTLVGTVEPTCEKHLEHRTEGATRRWETTCRRCHGYGQELNPDPSLDVPPFIPCRNCSPAEADASRPLDAPAGTDNPAPQWQLSQRFSGDVVTESGGASG